jgi:hypothetical protein
MRKPKLWILLIALLLLTVPTVLLAKDYVLIKVGTKVKLCKLVKVHKVTHNKIYLCADNSLAMCLGKRCILHRGEKV